VSELLAVRDLIAGYRELAVVRHVSLHVEEGEVVALLGPNGAGKTTTLLTACGLLPRIGGDIRIGGTKLESLSASAIARMGVSLVPEDRALFFDLTVHENIRLGARGNKSAVAQMLELFPELAVLASRKAGLLSGGEQQMLAIARGLAARPRLLVVDEMSLGLAPLIVERLLALLKRVVTDTGTALLLVEQHAHLSLGISDRAYVLNHGELVLEGRADDLRDRRDLLEVSYLGEAALADEIAPAGS
jgi:branched-chain amino acid transport system ATP-binding protein